MHELLAADFDPAVESLAVFERRVTRIRGALFARGVPLDAQALRAVLLRGRVISEAHAAGNAEAELRQQLCSLLDAAEDDVGAAER